MQTWIHHRTEILRPAMQLPFYLVLFWIVCWLLVARYKLVEQSTFGLVRQLLNGVLQLPPPSMAEGNEYGRPQVSEWLDRAWLEAVFENTCIASTDELDR